MKLVSILIPFSMILWSNSLLAISCERLNREAFCVKIGKDSCVWQKETKKCMPKSQAIEKKDRGGIDPKKQLEPEKKQNKKPSIYD